jgi:DNA-binding IclR family transcriptional regulator
MKFIATLERIERVDQLIRLKATGTPKELAARLGISESAWYELLSTMTVLGAPIYYSNERKSYCYKEEVKFVYGFKPKEE